MKHTEYFFSVFQVVFYRIQDYPTVNSNKNLCRLVKFMGLERRKQKLTYISEKFAKKKVRLSFSNDDYKANERSTIFNAAGQVTC